MEDQSQETVVTAPVDAEQTQETTTETAQTEETVVNTEVDAPKPDANVGEAIKKEVERREAQLKKQYEEQYAPVMQHSEQLKLAARINGWGDDVNSYVARLNEVEQQQKIEQEAATRGVDPDIYAQHIAPLSQENADLKTKLSAYEQQDQQKAQLENNSKSWGELYSAYPELIPRSKGFETGEPVDFFTPEMVSRIERGYSVKDAYELAHKETLFKQKEQEVLARVTGRDGKQVLSSIDSPNNIQFDPTNMSDADIQAISRRVQQGERITF